MERPIAYKLAHACYILENQESINEIILEFMHCHFEFDPPRRAKFVQSLEKGYVCAISSLQFSMPINRALTFEEQNTLSRNGFHVTECTNTIILDFSFWVNQILREKELQQQREMILMDASKELYKPGAIGQKAAEFDFFNIANITQTQEKGLD